MIIIFWKFLHLIYEKRMIAISLKVAAWCCLAFILFATVSPIGMRPHDYLPVNYDRALAFGVMSCLFTLAYPRRWRSILVLTVLGTIFIESLQFLAPTRHARLADAIVKASGSFLGVGIARICLELFGHKSVQRK